MNKTQTLIDMAYGVAYRCAECYDAGCNRICDNCQFDILHYGIGPESELIKSKAYADYFRYKEVRQEIDTAKSVQAWTPVVFMAIIIVSVMIACSTCAPGEIFSMDDKAPSIGRTVPLEITNQVQYLLANPNKLENIPLVFMVMRSQGVRDVNGDGKINCIDYSVTFRALYGSDAHLIVNRNPTNGFHHMFIIIYTPYGATSVEPQGTADRYAMGLVWGTRYKYTYNRDVTSSYGQVTGGML